MLINVLRSKIHRATVTSTELHYEGSIEIDMDLIEASGMMLHEKVDIYNINNGERFSTYIIEGPRGSRVICLNGAAARKACKGDQIIIAAYAWIPLEESEKHVPKIILLNPENQIA